MPTPIWHFALGIAEKPANFCQIESGTLARFDLQLNAEAGTSLRGPGGSMDPRHHHSMSVEKEKMTMMMMMMMLN